MSLDRGAGEREGAGRVEAEGGGVGEARALSHAVDLAVFPPRALASARAPVGGA
jgi:hypothetical protein